MCDCGCMWRHMCVFHLPIFFCTLPGKSVMLIKFWQQNPLEPWGFMINKLYPHPISKYSFHDFLVLNINCKYKSI